MAVTYEQVRDWVLALPGGCEVMVESWGHPTLRVGDKMIAGGAPGQATLSVKATREEQAELIASAPETYAIADYTGRYGWVRVTLATADAAELHRIVVDAWRRTAPKKAVRAYDSAQG
ncbi:MmcQ/YjbR family DNA-binding protein [Jidongwangia harbinensis]|uniref:MmcQ/YjbR family DNA-binding protein n=1 Tax=Jidongwangia harbinensis TaxID=2878561 RepID=UPI001CD99F5C|nr:MmcQ/YjbR family DNA-binding protein [Jidongwangia harbinensis]MCA2212512.1 MmcQ/YjbR family DNA-binding protein [Jidongwangia harbinensis]